MGLDDRLSQALIEVEADDMARKKIVRDQIEESRREKLDPFGFGAADDVLDTDDATDEELGVPPFEIEDLATNVDALEGSDISSDHKYIREYNYGLSKLYAKLIPRMVRQLVITDNPRVASSLNEMVEQVRKVHKDMIESSKVIADTKVKVKPVGAVGDRFGSSPVTEEGDEGEVRQITSSMRVDRMALLVNKIGASAPDWAFEKVAQGHDVDKVVQMVKNGWQPPIDGDVEDAETD